MGQIRCPETSVNNYHTTARNIPEERRSHQHGGRSLKSKKYYIFHSYPNDRVENDYDNGGQKRGPNSLAFDSEKGGST
jgi:hypothetical protein